MTAKAYLARAAAWVQKLSFEELRKKLGPCRQKSIHDACDFEDCPQRKVHLALCPLWTDEKKTEGTE